MAIFTIDEEKCTKDGLCSMACPVAVIEAPTKESFPKPASWANDTCIRCGHCVAVCPTGALTHKAMGPEDCPEIRKEFLLTPEQAEHFMRSRRSIRNYRKRPVEKEKLERLLDIVRYAQSGHNSQPIKWLIVQEPEEVQKYGAMVVDWMKDLLVKNEAFAKNLHMDMVAAAWEMGLDVVLRKAPHLVMAYADKNNPMAINAAAVSMTWLEMVAPTLGLGTCWAGYFTNAAQNWPPIIERLNLPEGHKVLQAAMVGFPKFAYKRLPARNPADIIWR